MPRPIVAYAVKLLILDGYSYGCQMWNSEILHIYKNKEDADNITESHNNALKKRNVSLNVMYYKTEPLDQTQIDYIYKNIPNLQNQISKLN